MTFTVSLHPTKFGGPRHITSGDITVLRAEEQDSKCLFISTITKFTKAYGMS